MIKVNKMNKIKLLGLLLAINCILIGCDDDSGRTPIISEIIPPVAHEYSLLQTNTLNSYSQNFTLEINDTDQLSFISYSGIQVTLSTSCLTLNGNPVVGEIEAKFIELFDQGSLITTGIATMGKHTDQSLEMLITHGVFHLSLFQNGQLLDLDSACGYSLQVPTSLIGEADYEMTLWHATAEQNTNLMWESSHQDQTNQQPIEIIDDNYYVWATTLGWINIGRFYTDLQPKTTISVVVPEGYSPENSSVYLLYKDQNGVARLNHFHTENGWFIEQYGKIPIGIEAYIIFTSEHQSQWVYEIQEIEITEDGLTEITSTKLKLTTSLMLNSLINNLL